MKAMLLIFSFAMVANAQPPDSLWSRWYGGAANDFCLALALSEDGGYLLAGSTGDFPLTGFHALKTNSNGDSLWSRTYGGSDAEACLAAGPTSDGGYILAGRKGPWPPDCWLVKTDANGDSLWSRLFENRMPYAVRQTSDGGYIVAGWGLEASSSNFWLMKTDNAGNSVWSRTYGGSQAECCYAVALCDDGGYLLAGYTISFGAGNVDMWLVKTGMDGDSLWSRTFGGSHEDFCASVMPTIDGGYVLAGYTRSFGTGTPAYNNFWLVRTDVDGDSLWSRTYGGSNDDICYGISPAEDSGLVVIGETYSFGAGTPSNSNYWLMKADANGDSVWSRTFGGSHHEQGTAVASSGDGSYLLAGSTESFGIGTPATYNFWLVKTGPEGQLLRPAPKSYATPQAYAISVYPNPFNATTTIRYDLPITGRLSIRLYDLMGREVTELINQVQKAGSHQLTLNAASLASGAYFVRMASGDFNRTQRIMLMR